MKTFAKALLWTARILSILAILFASLFTGCTSQLKKDASSNLDSIMEQYHEEWLRLYPMQATMAGDNRYDDLLYKIKSDITKE